jgi:hypothetical protein
MMMMMMVVVLFLINQNPVKIEAVVTAAVRLGKREQTTTAGGGLSEK